MFRTDPLLILLGLFLVAPTAGAAPSDDQGTYLGVLFRSRPEARGVLITHVLPGSPAARADLRRDDIIIGYDRRPVRDGDHMAELIRTDRPNRRINLQILRAGRLHSVEALLVLGPALRRSSARGNNEADARSNAGVSVWATPLPQGKTKLTIEYTAAGKVQVLTCSDATADLAATLQKLPERERQLVRVALQRLRTLNAPRPR